MEEVKKVSPGSLISIASLWPKLIAHGCANLILQSKKLQAALHRLCASNSILMPKGTRGQHMQPADVSAYVNKAKDHIMACAKAMRSIKNEGAIAMSDQEDVAIFAQHISSGIRNKLSVVHWAVLTPILESMDHNEAVQTFPMSPMSPLICPLSPDSVCPLSPSIDSFPLSSIDSFPSMAPLSPTSPLGKECVWETPEPHEKMSVCGRNGVGICKQFTPPKICRQTGGEVGTMDDANEMDTHGYPTIFNKVLQWAESVDDAPEHCSSKAGRRITHKQKVDGVLPPDLQKKTKVLKKTKQTSATSATNAPRQIAHADAVILTTFMSKCRKQDRLETKGQCRLSDNTIKEIGIIGMTIKQAPNLFDIGQELLNLCKNRLGAITKGEVVAAKQQLLINAD